MREVQVHIEERNPRTRHAVSLVLEDLLGWSTRHVDDPLAAMDGPLLVYGKARVPGALNIQPCGWLSEAGGRPCDPEVVVEDGLATLFPVSGGALSFDPFAAAFFQLSRHEEWFPMERDAHGRPITAALHAARNNYLHRPVVDEWAVLLARTWRAIDPRVPEPARAYSQTVTVDLDNGLKYRGRSWWRTLGSWFRDLLKGQWADVRERLDVLSGRIQDPFLIDDQLRSAFTHAAGQVKVFVLSAPRGEHDHAVPITTPSFADQLRSMRSWAQVGVHPSYESSERSGLAARERDALSRVIDGPVVISRQHFLRIHVPRTLRELEALGIREEHSLGLHDRLGFRCGTCSPYRWYDLELERPTELMIHPFTVMDNTLRDKLKLTPEEAVEQVRPLIDAVRRVNGTFIGLWHESFLARTGRHRAWRSAILSIIDMARP